MLAAKLILSSLTCTAVLVSCASERKVTVTRSSKETGVARYQSDVQFVKKKDGSVVPNKDLRSEFDGKRKDFGKLDFQGKEFSKQEYRKKRWEGEKQFQTKQYAGNTDASKFQYSPHFVQQQAKVQGKSYRDGEKSFSVRQVATKGAHEEDKKGLEYQEDSETNIRRKVFKQPLILSKEDYSNMSVEETRSLLGR